MQTLGDSQVTTEFVHLLEQNAQSHVAWTKLTVPQPSGTHLRRSRLVDKIHGLIDRKLILIRAHAGYGKTSLLIELAQETDLEVCWYTVEREDSDLAVFLTYLIASIARRFPLFGQRSLRLLQTAGSQIRNQLRVFAATLTDEMLQTIPEYFFLILDDYHALTEDSDVHEFIRLLLDFMPEQCHLVISSRTVPPLPLIRLVARQQMAAIGVDDLRFTETEIQQLALQSLDTPLSATQARSLVQQTDGWITAIWLSADRGWEALLKGAGSITPELSETRVYDYLMSEVFGCQPPEVKRFLLHTAVLKEMPISLCTRLLGKECTDLLYALERSSLFVSRVEEMGIETTFRYHPLFHNFLLSRLRQEQPKLYLELNARAGSIYESLQSWPSAILHYLRAEAFSRVRHAILTHFDELNRTGLRESVARWIDALPPQFIAPELQLKRATLAIDLGQVDTALRLCTNAIVLYESEGQRDALALALIERSLALSRIGRYADAMEDCEQALSLLPDGEAADSLRGRAYRYLGRYHGETGDADSALHYLSLAQECWDRCQEPPVRKARLAQDMGMAYELHGQFSQAIVHYTRAQSEWTRVDNPGEVAYALNGIGVAHHRLGEYRTALTVLHDALQKSQTAGSVRAEAYTLASLGDLYRDLGQCQRAIATYELAQDRAATIGDAYLRAYIANARMEALYLNGHVEAAQSELQQILSSGALSKSHESRYRLTLAATFLAQNDCARARQEIDAALVQSGTQSDLAFRGHMRLAAVAMQENRPEQTCAHLLTAFELARAAGLTQPLSVESLIHMPVLRFAVQKGGKSQELDQCIEAAESLERMRKELVKQIEFERSEPPQREELEIKALGSGCVVYNGQVVSWRTSQAKELFFYLLTQPEGQTKEQIGAAIWPHHSPAKLFSIFRSTLFRVRKALFPDAILFKNDQYAVNPEIICNYDVQEFEQEISIAELADNPVQRAYHYRHAVKLYQGPFLSDTYSDWATSLRESLQTQYLQALTFLARFNLERERYPRAIEYARRILAADEYYEVAYYFLISAYARSGQRPQARRIYAQCREMLAEFGLSPQKSWEELSR